MFVISLKATKKKAITVLLCVTAVVLLCSVIFISVNDASAEAANPVVQTNQERVDFLKDFGWEVKEEPSIIKEVVIPTEFSDVYENYNIIQKKQGYDLALYKGKRVKIWTYAVTNYPNKPDYINANLYVFEDKIIGGDISSTEINGFMHGFKKE